MPARLVTCLLAACVFVVLDAHPVAALDPTPPARPNIVVFYIDDVPPHDGRLWNDPSLTPNLYEQFVAHGIHLDHAIGEDPLCCPARGNVLTGLHTHNNRVTDNNALLFDPSVHIGKSLLEAGYASMYIGKYLNRDSDLTPEQWAEHDAGWTDLDVIDGINGDFYNYLLHTKTGEFRVRNLHSTQMVADRAVMHFRETPADTPIFAMLSIFNLHGPNIPLPEFVDDPRCNDMSPWDPPNYNEADVSDKPIDIQSLPLQPYVDGWPMARYCQEMLGVDKAVGQVLDELRAESRLDNTLLVFTADNGMAWGQHRLGQQKVWPYATPVPLYMRWADGHWGDTPQTVSEIVSNIDYAPTFCELAQTCVLGPFARGNAAPDGKSVVALLNGDATNLGRDAVLEESYMNSDSWSGLRTTELFDPVDRWHYVEYTNGFRELYDLINDPWELQNLATDSGKAALIATLHDRLAQLRLEGIAPGFGTINIVEDARPDSGSDYTFSGDLGSFTLDDDADPAHPNEQTFTDVPSGAYTLTRPGIMPWVPAEIDCDGVAAFDVPNGKVQIFLHPDENITCTYVDAQRQPDASISLWKRGTFRKDNFYSADAVRKQTARRMGLIVGQTYDYWVRLQNDSGAGDSFLVSAQTSGPSTVQVAFLFGTTDVTSSVAAGTYAPTFIAGGIVTLRMRVTIGADTPTASPFRVVVRATSKSDPSRVDVVRAVAVR